MSMIPLSRRAFIQAASIAAGAAATGFSVTQAFGKDTVAGTGMNVSELPSGAAPKPVAFPHFPDRLHAFVWRNWSVVPAERMARVVGAKPADIVRVGRAMGLSGPPRITRDQQARSFITVIKRNWHLLPYEQLLDLLGWSPDQLAYTLREDDFLFIKLGSLKPRCEPIRYQDPTQAVISREREIARIVASELPERQGAESPEALFDFVSDLSQKPGGSGRFKSNENASLMRQPADLNFCYSYFALYGDPLLDKDADPYPEGYLARLAQTGVTGVWLQAVLSKLSPFPWEPERSNDYQTRLKALRRLVARARKYGIRVFLYLNEPRAMPLKFFENHPQLKGTVGGDHATLCTSAPEVQRFLTDSIASICRAVPDLGGFFSITASENLTNCWSHGGGAKCPRCSTRSPATVIAEVNSLFARGIKESGTAAEMIVWDWGWNDAWAPDAIQQLPEGVSFMSVSEWRLPIERGGVKSEVGEYSISAVGPGPRASRHWQLARERGLRTIAKIQAGNTWELSSVPWIPAVENVARHAENLSKANVQGLMLGWTLGGYPSANLEVVTETMACGSADEAMSHVAERRFGASLAPAVVTAWRQFSTAFREFPYHQGLVYSGPQQLGPANLLWSEPTNYHASMVGFPYDHLDGWRSVYPAEVFIQQFDKVANGFTSALQSLRDAGKAAASSEAQRRALERECLVAEAAAIHFRSVANQARFVLARRAVAAGDAAEDSQSRIAVLESVLRDEISLARRLYLIQSSDSRIGFEASNQYFYVPEDLAEKVLNCQDLLTTWLPRLKTPSKA